MSDSAETREEGDLPPNPEYPGSYSTLLGFAGAFALLALAGCDRRFGVESHTSLPRPVDVRCVGAALASVPQAGRVRYHSAEDHSIEIYPRQRRVWIITHHWTYGERGASSLQISQTPDAWDFTNARVRIGGRVPDEEIARFVPLMHLVNSTVARRCGLPVEHLRPQQL